MIGSAWILQRKLSRHKHWKRRDVNCRNPSQSRQYCARTTQQPFRQPAQRVLTQRSGNLKVLAQQSRTTARQVGTTQKTNRYQEHCSQSRSLSKWEKLTQDPEVLGAIRGYRIFSSSPPSRFFLSEPVFSQNIADACDKKLTRLLSKEAIVTTIPSADQYLSRFFIFKKRGMRFILNLRFK